MRVIRVVIAVFALVGILFVGLAVAPSESRNKSESVVASRSVSGLVAGSLAISEADAAPPRFILCGPFNDGEIYRDEYGNYYECKLRWYGWVWEYIGSGRTGPYSVMESL